MPNDVMLKGAGKRGRKDATLYVRVPLAVYDALVDAADRGNRPISSQVEIYLKRCLKIKEARV